MVGLREGAGWAAMLGRRQKQRSAFSDHGREASSPLLLRSKRVGPPELMPFANINVSLEVWLCSTWLLVALHDRLRGEGMNISLYCDVSCSQASFKGTSRMRS